MSALHDVHHDQHPEGVPKLVGADAELGNLIEGVVRAGGTGQEAAAALLQEVDGVRSRSGFSAAGGEDGFAATDWSEYGEPSSSVTSIGAWDNPQDIGRKFLASNGGCVYIDLGHCEICTPEVVSAYDFVAVWHAMLRTIQSALAAANAKRPSGARIVALVNSSDGLGNAYGSHLNFLVTRRLWDDLFTRRLHPDLFILAAYLVSGIVISGQGKVGVENGRPQVSYQIAQRADYFDQLVGPQTTFDRPIVNSRDEPLCGSTGEETGLARLHCIFHDSTLCQISTLLKVGAMQIVLSMLEARWLDAGLMLEDPVTALTRYSHDPNLHAQARLADGRSVTAVDLQMMFHERAREFVDCGGCDGRVPGAAAIVELWGGTLCKLAQRDFGALERRLDWVLKRAQIERALMDRGLAWSAPEAKHLDHIYASLDPEEGLYWALQHAGLTETLIEEERIEHFLTTPPADTRAWTRAMLLRRLPRESIRSVDWDRIVLAPLNPGKAPTVVRFSNPLGDTFESWCRITGVDHL